MENDLLYNLEYQVNEKRKTRLSQVKHDTLTIKEFLDLGFNNSGINMCGKYYNLGFKWFVEDYKTKQLKYGYESSDFGELTKEQLDVEIEYVSSYLTDDNYLNVDVKLVNDDDIKYFFGESE